MTRSLGGKSAVLVGLSVCLGARATSTNRAEKIADLVRKGAQYANIESHISSSLFSSYMFAVITLCYTSSHSCLR